MHVLGELAEELSEELAEQRACQVHPLLGVVVAVVGSTGAHRGHEQFVHDVTQEVSLSWRGLGAVRWRVETRNLSEGAGAREQGGGVGKRPS